MLVCHLQPTHYSVRGASHNSLKLYPLRSFTCAKLEWVTFVLRVLDRRLHYG